MAISATQSRGYCNWIPLVTPAVQQDSCGLDEDLLWSRARKVGLVAIALIVLSIVYLAPVLALCAVPFTLIPLLDRHIATKAVEAKAVNEFFKGRPSSSATEWIRKNPPERWLVHGNRDAAYRKAINEIDRGGKTLIQNLHKPPTAIEVRLNEALLRNGYILADWELEKMVENENTELLEFVLYNKIVTPTKEQALSMWMNVKTKKGAELLKKYGVDINARNADGDTALLKVIKKNEMDKHTSSSKFHVRTLLEFGADPYISSKWGLNMLFGMEFEQDAFSTNTDPEIREILQPYRREKV